jgi:hypothetical protein
MGQTSARKCARHGSNYRRVERKSKDHTEAKNQSSSPLGGRKEVGPGRHWPVEVGWWGRDPGASPHSAPLRVPQPLATPPIVGGKLVARAPSPARWATDERGASGIRRHPSGFLRDFFGICSEDTLHVLCAELGGSGRQDLSSSFSTGTVKGLVSFGGACRCPATGVHDTTNTRSPSGPELAGA